MEFAWERLPIPKDAITVKTANAPARTAAIFLFLNAFLIVYIGPPEKSPFSFTLRYFTASAHSAYFVEMPKAAAIHIHTSAPGPPITIAVATPTIFPVPIVPASAVINAEKGEIAPFSPFVFLESGLTIAFRELGSMRQGINFSLKVRDMPVPTSSIRVNGPQTMLSALSKIV